MAAADTARTDQGPALGIARLTLRTHRLPELRAFYHRKLHFPIRGETRNSITFQAGATSLTFLRTEEKSSRPFYHFAFNIPENKLPLAAEWLSERTPLAADGKVFHFSGWNAHSIYFWDPAGNLGELIARHNLPNARPSAFSPSDILYASEIGLVVEDVPTAVRQLQRSLTLPAYRPAAADFATLGDEHRLLIVAKKGRPWLQRESEVFPTTAILHGVKSGKCDLAGHPYSVAIKSSQ